MPANLFTRFAGLHQGTDPDTGFNPYFFGEITMEAVVRDKMYSMETGCEIVEFTPADINRDAPSEMSFDEIDAWARHALAANGFGDY